MPKNIIIRKGRNKIEIRDTDGSLICDVIIAESSRTFSANLSVKASKRYVISNVSQSKSAAAG